MQSLSLITPPAVEPIHLDEAKSHLRLFTSDEDPLVTVWIAAARQYVENITSRQLVTATWRLTIDRLPWTDCAIELRRPPVQSVAAFSYTNDAGSVTALATGGYQANVLAAPGLLQPSYGSFWPGSRSVANGVAIDFIAGYVTPIQANTAGDTFTAFGRTFANGDLVTLSNSGGGLPAGFAPRTTYYVVNASGNTFKLAATLAGSALAVPDSGTGQHFVGELPATIRAAMLLLVGNWYENRSQVITGTISTEIEKGVDALLMGERWETH